MSNPEQPAAGSSELRKRVLSGIVMATAAIGVTIAGGPAFAILWTGAALAVAFEWQRLCHGGTSLGPTLVSFGTVILAAAGAYFALPFLFLMALVGVGAAALASPAGLRLPSATGALYAAALGGGALLCRGAGYDGAVVIFWLFAVVWGTDILAYFTGRSLGGPKLWPRVSPKKTWSGAIGGLVGGVVLGAAVLAALGVSVRYQHVMLSIAFSILTQCGDLYESAIKRRFNVKDSGSLIPGHGGFMDRLDGFIFAVAAAAFLGVLRGGTSGVPQALVVWP